MPIATDFEYHKPKDLPEATALLARYQGRAQLMAGGKPDLNLHRFRLGRF